MLFHEHDITIPIINKETTTDFDGGNDLQEVLYNLEELAKKAEESSQKSVERSNHARSSFIKAKQEYNVLMARKKRVENNFKTADQIIKEITGHIREADQNIKQADNNAKSLGQARKKAMQLSQEVCQSIQEIEQNPSGRSTILSSNAEKKTSLQNMFSTGRGTLFTYQDAIRSIQAKTDTMIQRQGDLAHLLSTETQKLDQGLILDLIIDADISGIDAQDHLDTIGDILVDAKKEYQKGSRFVKNVRPENEQTKMQKRLDNLMDRIKIARTTAQNANEPFTEQVEQLNKQLESDGPQFDALNTKIGIYHKKTNTITSDRERVTKKADQLVRGQSVLDDDLAAIENAIMDAEICSESVQTTAAEQADGTCSRLTSSLNKAYQNKDAATYNQLLKQYANCPGYSQAQNAYNTLVQENNRCNRISRQLEAAQKKGDSQAYGNLLNQFRGCLYYYNALAIYEDMRRSDERCNFISDQLNQAQRNGDIRLYGTILQSFKGCDYYNQALNVYNAMVQNANNQRCNQLINQLNQAQRQKDVRTYQSLLSQSQDCSFYNQAQNVYNGMKNQQTMQAMNNFMGGLMQIMNQKNNPNNRRSPYQSPPPQRPKPPSGPSNPTTSTTQTGGSAMSQVDCEIKFCPVCKGGNNIDLIGVSVNNQCNDCRKQYKKKIDDCAKGGISANRAGNSMSQFKKYQVIKCTVPVKDSKGKIIRYNSFYEFSGPSRKRPQGARCAVVGNGTWDECIDKARDYNKRNGINHSVMP